MSSVFNNVRNYLQERLQHVKREWQIYQATGASSSNMTEERIQQLQDLDTRRMFHTARNAFDTTTNTPGPVSRITEEQRRLIYDAESDKIMNALRQHDEMRSQPFELFMTRPDSDPIPPNRIAAPGIWQSPLQFHTGQIVHADPSTTSVLHPDEHEDYAESYLPGDTDQGYEIDPTIYELLTRKYPEYLPYITTDTPIDRKLTLPFHIPSSMAPAPPPKAISTTQLMKTPAQSFTISKNPVFLSTSTLLLKTEISLILKSMNIAANATTSSTNIRHSFLLETTFPTEMVLLKYALFTPSMTSSSLLKLCSPSLRSFKLANPTAALCMDSKQFVAQTTNLTHSLSPFLLISQLTGPAMTNAFPALSLIYFTPTFYVA
nr:defective RNA dependent RNA polymerase [Rosellinia necatrix partitivirus 6]